ncbi:hypothetical protein AB0J27_20315 [Micromonospora chokoriensis]
MTTAPKCLLDARTLLLTHLRPHGLTAAAVGIVGDSAHRGGYHCGRDRLVSNDYSNRVARDKAGLSDYASALDIGTFAYGRHNLRTFSVWLVAECAKGTADTRDIREVIYSPDGKTVKRWDRERRSSTGDDSHLWHTHISFYRDATKAGRDLSAVFRRYLVSIGLLEDDDMDATERAALMEVRDNLRLYFGGMSKTVQGTTLCPTDWRIRDEKWQASVTAKLSAAPTPAPVAIDPAALSAALAEPAFLAALARAVNDDAARRLSE